jgi:hypothetical protein
VTIITIYIVISAGAWPDSFESSPDTKAPDPRTPGTANEDFWLSGICCDAFQDEPRIARIYTNKNQKFVQIGVIRGLDSAWMKVITATPQDPDF